MYGTQKVLINVYLFKTLLSIYCMLGIGLTCWETPLLTPALGNGRGGRDQGAGQQDAVGDGVPPGRGGGNLPRSRERGKTVRRALPAEGMSRKRS